MPADPGSEAVEWLFAALDSGEMARLAPGWKLLDEFLISAQTPGTGVNGPNGWPLTGWRAHASPAGATDVARMATTCLAFPSLDASARDDLHRPSVAAV
jgi:hypothetical protein